MLVFHLESSVIQKSLLFVVVYSFIIFLFARNPTHKEQASEDSQSLSQKVKKNDAKEGNNVPIVPYKHPLKGKPSPQKQKKQKKRLRPPFKKKTPLRFPLSQKRQQSIYTPWMRTYILPSLPVQERPSVLSFPRFFPKIYTLYPHIPAHWDVSIQYRHRPTLNGKKIWLFSYADDVWRWKHGDSATKPYIHKQNQTVLHQTAVGRVDHHIRWLRDTLPPDFRDANADLLSDSQWAGNGLWKGKLLTDSLDQMQEGDWGIYLDAGFLIDGDLEDLISPLNNHDLITLTWTDLFVRRFCRKSVPLAMGYSLSEMEGCLIASGVIIFKKNAKITALLKEWLHWIQKEEIIRPAFDPTEHSLFAQQLPEEPPYTFLVREAQRNGLKVYNIPTTYPKGPLPALFKGAFYKDILLWHHRRHPHSLYTTSGLKNPVYSLPGMGHWWDASIEPASYPPRPLGEAIKVWCASFAADFEDSDGVQVANQNFLNWMAFRNIFDGVLTYRSKDLDPGFLARNQQAIQRPLDEVKNLWQSHIMLKALRDIPENEVLVFCSPGTVPLKPLTHYIERLRHHDIVLFERESHATGNNFCETPMVVRNTPQTRQFIEQWQTACERSLGKPSPKCALNICLEQNQHIRPYVVPHKAFRETFLVHNRRHMNEGSLSKRLSEAYRTAS
jgi:hypothetical protein